jgi:hypothetical protein
MCDIFKSFRSQSTETVDTGVADASTIADASLPMPGESRTLPELSKPPILFPPLKPPLDPPDKHPSLVSECPNNGFFGDPTTRSGAVIKGIILASSEQAKRLCCTNTKKLKLS